MNVEDILKNKIVCSIAPKPFDQLKHSRSNVLYILYNSLVCYGVVEGLIKVKYYTVLEREFETSWSLHRKGLEFQQQVKESCHVFNSYLSSG